MGLVPAAEVRRMDSKEGHAQFCPPTHSQCPERCPARGEAQKTCGEWASGPGAEHSPALSQKGHAAAVGLHVSLTGHHVTIESTCVARVRGGNPGPARASRPLLLSRSPAPVPRLQACCSLLADSTLAEGCWLEVGGSLRVQHTCHFPRARGGRQLPRGVESRSAS